jgi:FMN reductase (NADPH)
MNPTLDTLQSLRTIHGSFSDQTISSEDVATILETATRAANASNRQSYSIVDVKDPEMMAQLTGYQGNRLLLFCVDFNRLTATAARLGHEYPLRGVAPFLTGAIDTTLAAQTAAIAAKSLGIDSLFTNGIHRGDVQRVYDLLNLPEKLCFPLIALILGYPAQDDESKALRGRLTGPGVIHQGTYQAPTDDELQAIIEAYDDPRTELGLAVPWKEKGFDHFLDWFFEVWSSRGPASDGRSQLFQRLIDAGFLDTEDVDT